MGGVPIAGTCCKARQSFRAKSQSELLDSYLQVDDGRWAFFAAAPQNETVREIGVKTMPFIRIKGERDESQHALR